MPRRIVIIPVDKPYVYTSHIHTRDACIHNKTHRHLYTLAYRVTRLFNGPWSVCVCVEGQMFNPLALSAAVVWYRRCPRVGIMNGPRSHNGSDFAAAADTAVTSYTQRGQKNLLLSCFTNSPTCAYVCRAHTHKHTHKRAHTNVHIYIYIRVYRRIVVFMCIICICVYIG